MFRTTKQASHEALPLSPLVPIPRPLLPRFPQACLATLCVDFLLVAKRFVAEVTRVKDMLHSPIRLVADVALGHSVAGVSVD